MPYNYIYCIVLQIMETPGSSCRSARKVIYSDSEDEFSANPQPLVDRCNLCKTFKLIQIIFISHIIIPYLNNVGILENSRIFCHLLNISVVFLFQGHQESYQIWKEEVFTNTFMGLPSGLIFVALPNIVN